MAHIQRMTDKPRSLPWRAHINRKGHKPIVKMFKTRAEAERWANEQERNIRLAGLPLTIDDLKKHTVGDIVRRYLEEITPTKGCRVSETTVLNKFLTRKELCAKSLAYISRQDAYSYVKDRLKEPWRGKLITPRTVRREINSIQHVFEVAKEQWGMENLVNVFRKLPIKGAIYRRKRRLQDGDLDKLNAAIQLCRGLNRYYVALAMYLAIETGMRLQEIFNLRWCDVDIDTRRITIRYSKTDYLSGDEGRTIVLTFFAQTLLTQLAVCLHKQRGVPGPIAAPDIKSPLHDADALIFPMTKEAFKQSWMDVRKRSGVGNLTFHDLRREAGSRFDQAGLTKGEHDLMMGHANRDMTSLYIHADLKSIQDKLDRHALKGLTLAEMADKIKKEGIPPEQVAAVQELIAAWNDGATKKEARARCDEALRAWKAKSDPQGNVVPFAATKAS